MLNIYDLPAVVDPAPEPSTLGSLLQALHGNYDQIARVEFASLEEMQTAAREQMHFLTHSFEITNRTGPQHFKEVVEIAIYWAVNSDIVLWAEPPKSVYHHAILFDIYEEFVQWTGWRLRAGMNCTEDELECLRLTLESLKIKVTCPRCLVSDPISKTLPLITELQLV